MPDTRPPTHLDIANLKDGFFKNLSKNARMGSMITKDQKIYITL